MRKYRNQIISGLAFMAAALAGVFLVSNVNEMLSQLGSFPFLLFIPLLLLKSVNWVLRYLEWEYFLRVIHVKTVWGSEHTRPAPAPNKPATIGRQDSFILWMVGLIFAVSPAKVAEVLKTLILKNMIGVSFSRSMPVIFAERLVDGIAIVGMIFLSVLAAGGAIFATEEISAEYVQLVVGAAVVGMFGLIVVLQSHSLTLRILQVLERLPLVKRFADKIQNFYESSFQLTRLRHILPTTGFGFIAYIADCIGFFLMLVGFGLAPTLEVFAIATFILSFAGIVSAISALPGGAGGRELTTGAMLLALFDLSSGAVGALVVMVSLYQLWLGVMIGMVLALIYRKRLFPPDLEEEIEAYQQQHDDQATVLA